MFHRGGANRAAVARPIRDATSVLSQSRDILTGRAGRHRPDVRVLVEGGARQPGQRSALRAPPAPRRDGPRRQKLLALVRPPPGPSRSARRPPSGRPIFSESSETRRNGYRGSSKRPHTHNPSRLSSGSSLSCHVPASLAVPSSPTRRSDPCGGSKPISSANSAMTVARRSRAGSANESRQRPGSVCASEKVSPSRERVEDVR